MAVERDVEISGETIRLGQFLKLANAIDSGADAKALLADGGVTVNGEPETRRGRQLAKGDRVTTGAGTLRVS
jgi:ribosome-associated protein